MIAGDRLREEWQYLQPMDVIGSQFTRIGRQGDGGYVMIDDFADCRYALSFGVRTGISWDLALAERGLSVFLYDHKIDAIPIEHANLKFRRIGLGYGGGNECQKRSIAELLKQEGIIHHRTGLILKIDIEGDEWDVLRQVSEKELRPFAQIMIEFHNLADCALHQHTAELYALKKLAETHQVVHLHANNYGECAIIGGVAIPDVLEVTYASREKYSFAECTRRFPTIMDYPNNPDRADIALQGAFAAPTRRTGAADASATPSNSSPSVAAARSSRGHR